MRFDESNARLMVVNTVPGAPSIEAFLDNTILHVDPMKYLANTYYRNVISGKRNFKIRENGNLVVDTNFVFDREQTYSVFVYKENSTTKILLLKDDIKIDENGLTRYRFLNFSPNAGTLTQRSREKESIPACLVVGSSVSKMSVSVLAPL